MKKLVILLAFLMMLPVAMATDFEFQVNDVQGDVGNADIDIIQAWTTVEGSNLAVHIKVAGKISNAYSYNFEFNDGSYDVGAVYSNGIGYYSGVSSAGQATASINGDTIVIEIPYSVVSSLNADTLQFRVFAGDATTNTWDYTSFVSSGGGGGGGEEPGGDNEINDPTKQQPTDESISVEITDVEYSMKKLDANTISGHVTVRGTTNGADHVSLTFVVYYKNGTYDYGSWITGPSEFHQHMGSYSIDEFFNATEGNWNKWVFNVSGTYPMSNYNWAYDMFKGENEVSKVVVYARAFKDSEETKWNQAKFETIPSFTAASASYGVGSGGDNAENNADSSSSSSEKSKTPGFEFVSVAVAIIAIAFITKKARHME